MSHVQHKVHVLLLAIMHISPFDVFDSKPINVKKFVEFIFGHMYIFHKITPHMGKSKTTTVMMLGSTPTSAQAPDIFCRRYSWSWLDSGISQKELYLCIKEDGDIIIMGEFPI
ncbi:hypothetical protein K435DRAFT_813929 [Dendrothele bispora CBS 962.96]|uniref:Uncharacterized protein n=1 Tax=Dendrothele bispora (strain CBS 962.96) TaxID=1314807 RepID=A0A4S8KL31_DENBC|nr:hypothetical protein K435DRAFT_813929 [Dendrothele bispora CBS 962.96]